MRNCLGIVLPMGQNRKRLEEAGQWSLWQQELEFYRRKFKDVEFFEYRYKDWRRYVEALFLPVVQANRFQRCQVLKAVHLTGVVPCLVARLLYRTPFVLSYGYRYDEFAALERRWNVWLLSKLLTPMAIIFSSAVMVPTEELKSYVRNFGARKVEVIPNGVDTKLFKGPTSPRQGRTFKILFVGRLEKQKNLEALIRAEYQLFKGRTLHPQGPTLRSALRSIRLTFIGSGSLRQKLLGLAKKLNVNVEIRNPVQNSDLPNIYQLADIFVLPSLAEGHPKVLLEAMSCGIPCLASAISGTTEIITHGRDGWLVEPTVIGIAQGLDHLIKDRKLRIRLGAEARKTVVDRFDKGKLIKKETDLLSLIRSDLGVRRSRTF